LQKYSWLEEYMWKLVDKNKDEYTRKVAGTGAEATSCELCQAPR